MNKPTEIFGIRTYQGAYSFGPDNERVTDCSKPFIGIDLYQIQFIGIDGEVIGWTESIMEFRHGAMKHGIQTLDLGINGDGSSMEAEVLMGIERAFVVADGSTQYAGGAPAPPMMCREKEDYVKTDRQEQGDGEGDTGPEWQADAAGEVVPDSPDVSPATGTGQADGEPEDAS